MTCVNTVVTTKANISIEELLKSIPDAAKVDLKNWFEFNIENILEVLSKLANEDEFHHFMEAGFVIERCTKLYTKKISLLHQFVLDVANLLIGTPKQIESDETASRRRCSSSRRETAINFVSLDDFEESNLDDLNFTQEFPRIRESHFMPSDLNIDVWIKGDAVLIDSNGEDIGKWGNFGINYCFIHESGALLPPLYSPNSVLDEDEEMEEEEEEEECNGQVIPELENDCITFESEPLDDGVDESPAPIIRESEVTPLAPTSNSKSFLLHVPNWEVVAESEQKCRRRLPKKLMRMMHEEGPDISTFIQARCFGKKMCRITGNAPLNDVFVGLVNEIFEERRASMRYHRKRKHDRSSSELNTAASHKSNSTLPSEGINGATNMNESRGDTSLPSPHQANSSNTVPTIELEERELTLTRQLDAYYARVSSVMPRDEQTVSLKLWASKMKCRIAEEERKEKFDLVEYCGKLMSRMCDQPIDQRPFKELCDVKEWWQMCRFFVASLHMANDHRIVIKPEGRFSLSLSSLTSHNDSTETENLHESVENGKAVMVFSR